MEHAKKYVLVDPQIYRPSMPEKSLSTLDTEIQTILNGDSPDDQKAMLYTLTLKKFKAFDNNSKAPDTKITVEDKLVGELPPNQQYKANKLLRLIRDNPDIEWSDKGELIYKQSLVPNSHITDIFDDVFAIKKPVEGPPGWEEFDDALDSSKVPTNLVKRRIKKQKRPKSVKAWEQFDDLESGKIPANLAKRRSKQQKQSKLPKEWIEN